MVFSSSIFVFFFLPLVLLCYFVAPKKLKNYCLLIFSLIFYLIGGPKYILLLISVVLLNYISTLLMDKYNKIRKQIFVTTIVLNILTLTFFKYIDFIIGNINFIFNSNIKLLNIVLPIGISFYMFQIIGYLVDVYNKKVNVQKNFFNLLLYVSFFSQLIAGPIVRYKTIEKEINKRNINEEDICYGIERFILGFFKKLVIANQVGALADIIFNLENISMPIAWLGAFAFMIQIYFDFSGYSDMAIGLGRIFGFHFDENFNYPYISKSITDFWRRWHISLSAFFKDYVYIPLGGNRCLKKRMIFNLFIVWFLTGLWHGASWNYVIWGLYYFIFLILEKFIFKDIDKFKIISRIYTLLIVLFGWVIFKAESLSMLIKMFKSMFSLKMGDINGFLIYLETYYIYIILGIIFSTPIYKVINNKFKNNIIFNIIKYIGLIIVFIVSIMFLAKNTYNPFIYFRF